MGALAAGFPLLLPFALAVRDMEVKKAPKVVRPVWLQTATIEGPTQDACRVLALRGACDLSFITQKQPGG